MVGGKKTRNFVSFMAYVSLATPAAPAAVTPITHFFLTITEARLAS